MRILQTSRDPPRTKWDATPMTEGENRHRPANSDHEESHQRKNGGCPVPPFLRLTLYHTLMRICAQTLVFPHTFVATEPEIFFLLLLFLFLVRPCHAAFKPFPAHIALSGVKVKTYCVHDFPLLLLSLPLSVPLRYIKSEVHFFMIIHPNNNKFPFVH